jgi:hypothetical protein
VLQLVYIIVIIWLACDTVAVARRLWLLLFRSPEIRSYSQLDAITDGIAVISGTCIIALIADTTSKWEITDYLLSGFVAFGVAFTITCSILQRNLTTNTH